MRRLIVVLLATLALAVGASSSVFADTTVQLSLACSDGTAMALAVDASTLTDLTGEVQALNPGLTCTLSDDLLATDNSGMALVSTPTCLTTDFMQDGRLLTALLINPVSVTGAVDAAGACDIAVYYNSAGAGGTVEAATISNAIYYGVLDNNAGAQVDVRGSNIKQIGDATFDGSQHGVGIAYTGSSANGTVDNNTISLYQKNGMAMKNGAAVSVTNNTVTGRGRTKVIAQNGIEFYQATSPNLTGNTVSMNIYTQNTSCTPGCVGSTTGVTATGFLLFQTNFKNPGQVAPYNHAYRNQVDYYVVN
ncbi:MAG: hypothetical protein QOH92_3169 [Chloroflexota bacterium]|jgi:parallel beta-helix repeat protein|nr:hypothetical protein [Chloroflexota bacterium]